MKRPLEDLGYGFKEYENINDFWQNNPIDSLTDIFAKLKQRIYILTRVVKMIISILRRCWFTSKFIR